MNRRVQLWENEAGRVALVTHSHVIAMRRLDDAARFVTDAPRVGANPPDSWPGADVLSPQQWERGEPSPSSFGGAVWPQRLTHRKLVAIWYPQGGRIVLAARRFGLIATRYLGLATLSPTACAVLALLAQQRLSLKDVTREELWPWVEELERTGLLGIAPVDPASLRADPASWRYTWGECPCGQPAVHQGGEHKVAGNAVGENKERKDQEEEDYCIDLGPDPEALRFLTGDP